jgi:hypothetical protein
VLINLFVLRTLLPLPLVPIALIVAVDLLSIWIVRRGARRAGWGMRQRLALASGVMGFFIVFSPIFEFLIPSQDMTRLTVANLLALGGLILLARWVARQQGTARPVRSPHQAHVGDLYVPKSARQTLRVVFSCTATAKMRPRAILEAVHKGSSTVGGAHWPHEMR